MLEEVDDLLSFDEIIRDTDWLGFELLPASEAGNRITAYRVFPAVEWELLAQ